jgi:hypothetical protein
MSQGDKEKLDECLDEFAARLPAKAGQFTRWITSPSATVVRIPVGGVLIAGGVVGFLPILGFWMVPLGLAVIAQDVPALRPPMTRMLGWINRKLPEPRDSEGGRRPD